MRIFINEFCGHPYGSDLGRELARRGHQVYLAYFADNHSTPKGANDNRDHLPNLTIAGLRIQRAFEKHGLLSRRAADLEYGKVVAAQMRQFRPDVVLSGNMPLDAQRILLRASHNAGAKFVFWLQDVYSNAVRFVLGRKAPILADAGAWYYERVERKLLNSSDAIVCIAPAFRDLLSVWKVNKPDVKLIPNWAPLAEIRSLPKVNNWARENGVADKLCLIYSGTLGMKHRPELLLELAHYLEEQESARLVVIAGGAGAEWLAQRKHRVKGDALKLLPFQPYERVPEALAAADILIGLLDSEAGAFAVPSKTMAYLCAGRPILLAAPRENEAAQVIMQADAGLVVSPDQPEQLFEGVRTLLENPDLRARLGKNARKYAERAFAIETIADQFMEAFSGSHADQLVTVENACEPSQV